MLGHRQLVILNSNNIDSSYQQLQNRQLSHTEQLTFIDTTKDFNQNRWLGLELQDCLIHFNNQTSINSLLSIWGCIKAPYTIFLSYPHDDIESYFKKRILLPKLQQISHNNQKANDYLTFETAANEHPSALEKLLNSESITHLIGQRGTGKSTLLGKYIIQTLKNNLSVLLCSPSKKASANTLAHLPSNVSRETFTYTTPKTLLHTAQNYKVIIIDEASSLHSQLIEYIIEHIQQYPEKKLILSTTTEGYEGTGQSYRINYLDSNQQQIIQLQQPKRFANTDPIHQLALALCNPQNSQTSPLPDGVYLYNNQELREQKLTNSCFALLQQAHYKTTPNDLARFYDDPAIFAVYIKQNKIVGAAYSVTETLPSDVEPTMIYHGIRRTKNALTHQAIISAYGENQKYPISNKKTLRISRIATEKSTRRTGVASQMIATFKKHAIQQQYHFLSTSFSCSEANLMFWKAQQFTPARIGTTKNKWNNSYALLMLLPLDNTSENISAYLVDLYHQHLYYFKKSYPDIKISRIKNTQKTNHTELVNDINSVINYHRELNWLLPKLNQLLSTSQALPSEIKTQLEYLLDGKLKTKKAAQESKQLLIRLNNYLQEGD